MESTKKATLLLLLLTSTSVIADHPEITLDLGVISGSYMTTLNGRSIATFRGIPYAKPPIGQLRFKPPEKLTDPLSPQPFDASKDGNHCCQLDVFTGSGNLTGEEDCLILNVYTPKINQDNIESEKLAVMVVIHGGAFTYGSGAILGMGPKKLLDHDVILVTFNYRLHVLGFLSTASDDLPGNYGHLDQVLALKWVQENIHAFGGDPDRVTLLGISAGAASVGYHLLSSLSSGLFSAAIQMSGNPLNTWAFDNDPMPLTREYAIKLNCNDTESNELIKCLQEIPVDELLAPLPEYSAIFLAPFRPTVDGYFLTDYPLNLYKNGQFARDIPIMLGIAEFEGNAFYAMERHKIPTNFDEAVKQSVKSCLHIDDDNRLNIVSELVKPLYFQTTDRTNATELQQQLIQFFNDCSMAVSHYFTLNSYTNSNLTTYAYSFDYVTNHSMVGIMLGLENFVGASHGDDSYFLLDCPFFLSILPDQQNDVNENKFLELWVNFAKYRNPTPEDKNKLLKWPLATEDDLQIYHLNNPLRVEKFEIDNELINFWFNKIPNVLMTPETVLRYFKNISL